MATQQKTGDETRTGQNRNRNEQSGAGPGRDRGNMRGQSTQSGQQNGESESRAMQRQQVPAFLSPLMLGPFALIRGLQEGIDRAFGVAARNQSAMARPNSATGLDVSSPPIETLQRGNEFVVRAAVPGLSADDLTIEVGEDAITIRGERQYEHDEERDGMYVTEFSYGAFARVVPLPPGAIPDNARAELRDGVLEIAVPAPSPEARRGRRLEIQGSSERADRGKEQQNRG